MTITEAANILKAMHSSALPGEQVVQIHLFGIKYAKELDGLSATKIAEQAGIGSSFGTEISKGKKLARYVRIV